MWDDAIERAKENLGIIGYTEDFDEVVDEAKKQHEDFIKSLTIKPNDFLNEVREGGWSN